MSESESIVPDTRDWAEVLERGCTACGFTGNEDALGASAEISAGADRWAGVLDRPDATRRTTLTRYGLQELRHHLHDVEV